MWCGALQMQAAAILFGGSPHPRGMSGVTLSHLLQGPAAHAPSTAGTALAALVTWRQDKEEHSHFTDGKTEASRSRHLPHSVKNAYFLSILLIDPSSM